MSFRKQEKVTDKRKIIVFIKRDIFDIISYGMVLIFNEKVIIIVCEKDLLKRFKIYDVVVFQNKEQMLIYYNFNDRKDVKNVILCRFI